MEGGVVGWVTGQEVGGAAADDAAADYNDGFLRGGHGGDGESFGIGSGCKRYVVSVRAAVYDMKEGKVRSATNLSSTPPS